MHDLSEQAKLSTPERLTVISAGRDSQEYYCAVNERFASIKNQFNDIACFVVEIHPLLKLKRSDEGLRKELFKGTSRSNHATNRFYLNVDRTSDVAFFGPLGAIYLDYDLRGYGFGSYMFNELVKWGKRHHGEIHVRKGSLALADARDEESRQRRNQFYRQFGFELVPPDPLTGIFRANTLADLKHFSTLPRIKAFPSMTRIIDAYPNFDLPRLQEEIISRLS